MSHIPLQETVDFVRELHGGQVDKAGQPYFEHLARVFATTQKALHELPGDLLTQQELDDIQHAALLHDSMEDQGITADGLRARGYSERVIWLVDKLTRRPADGTYMDKIRAIAATRDIGLIVIKLSDNLDNSAPERIASLPPEEQGILNRYERSKKILRAALSELVPPPKRQPPQREGLRHDSQSRG